MSEFAFELELCAHLESRREGIVARQLGAGVAAPGGRILDIVCVEPGPTFDDRVAITSESIPDAAIASAVGTGRARYWKDAFDCHPDRARRAVDRALEVGFFERDHRASADANREYVRQTTRYPDWDDRIVGIENKPDLGRPGDLEAQLRTDVSLAVVDAVVLATESYVTRAHLNRLPDEVGVWRVHREDEGDALELEVIREPTTLPVDQPGIEPLAFEPGQTDIEVVSTEAKARARRRLAERAYGKGWRTFSLPACARCSPAETAAAVPYCAYHGRIVNPVEDCGESCPGHEPADPPAVDLDAVRDDRSPWVADPDGRQRRQVGLDRFG